MLRHTVLPVSGPKDDIKKGLYEPNHKDKHDKYLENDTENIDSAAELPPIENWAQYEHYKRRKFAIKKPRFPSMRGSKRKQFLFCRRRAWKLMTFNGILSNAYISIIHHENKIIAVIFFGSLTQDLKYIDPSGPPPTTNRTQAITEITASLVLIMLIVYVIVGIMKILYTVADSSRSMRQLVQRAIIDDFEEAIAAKQVVFITRGSRFDSADLDWDAREAIGLLWGNAYETITGGGGLMGMVRRFFLLEDDKLRRQMFGDDTCN